MWRTSSTRPLSLNPFDSPSFGRSVRAPSLFASSDELNSEFLATEPIVTALSAWIGFAWACLFLGLTSVGLVFRGYGFNDGQAGTMQL